MQAIGVVVAQVLFCGERQVNDVVDTLNVLGRQVHSLHLVAIEGSIMVHIVDKFLQAFALQSVHLITTHTLLVWIPNHYYKFLVSYKRYVELCFGGGVYLVLDPPLNPLLGGDFVAPLRSWDSKS